MQFAGSLVRRPPAGEPRWQPPLERFLIRQRSGLRCQGRLSAGLSPFLFMVFVGVLAFGGPMLPGRAAEGEIGAGYRSLELPVPQSGKAGFTLLSAATTGRLF